MKIGVLLSVGQHPASRRARASHADLAALRLALATGLPVVGLHAGAMHEALRDYGAYGLEALQCLDAPSAQDGPACDHLARHVAGLGITCLVAGALGERPEAQGLFPYRVAHALGWPLHPGVVALQRAGARWQAIARLDATTRRCHGLDQGAVLQAWPAGLQHMAYAALRRERLRIDSGEAGARTAAPAAACTALPISPTLPAPRMPQPAWTRPDARDNAATRLATLRGERAHAASQRIDAPTPQEAAQHLLAFLRRHGLPVPHHTMKDVDSDHTV
ncbi:MAG TPA: hypothetical protein VMS38_25315 [Pseudorhodoferax sp.]|nr:hypothetical protein [Pseudorhodoferax sp.]